MNGALSRWFLPLRCSLCRADIRDGSLCADCERALPWNRHACRSCALPLPAASEICSACLEHPPGFDAAYAAFRLEAPVQQAIHALKYHAQFGQAHLLGRLMAMSLARRAAPLPQCVLPVPLHPHRLRRRGYNQAQLLAEELGQALYLRTETACLVRPKPTEDQIGKTAVERHRNVRGAFGIRGDLANKHIALVDDVMTTGATLGELARVCRAAGAAKIEVWVAARAV